MSKKEKNSDIAVNTHDWVSKLSQCAIPLDELKSNIKLGPGDIAYNPVDMVWQVGTENKPVKIADEDITNAVFDAFDNAITNASSAHAEGTCTSTSSGYASGMASSASTSSASTSSVNGGYSRIYSPSNLTWKAVIEDEPAYWKEQFDGSHYCSNCGRDALLGPDGTEFLSEYCPHCGKRII